MTDITAASSDRNSFLDFAYWGRFEDTLKKLSEIAMPESWDYHFSESRFPLPILYNYLSHTFLRVEEQGKIVRSGDYACFNTGLVTKHQQEIFALFKSFEEGKLSFVGFNCESDSPMQHYSPLPQRATYYDDPSELILDPSLDFRINIQHIVDDKDNFDRFPDEIKKLPKHMVLNLFNGALDHARKRVERNYKTAIPQYYRSKKGEGNIQLLLPLCLLDPSKADLALTVYKHDGFYMGRTCLTLDMAINNARLIAKPDDEWLRP